MTTMFPILLAQLQQHIPSTSVGGTTNPQTTKDPTNTHSGETDHDKTRTLVVATYTTPEPFQEECTYEHFSSFNPPTFSFKGGESGLLKWIEEMETKHKISECHDDLKVS